MIRCFRLFLATTLLCCLYCGIAAAQEKPRVLILPFTVQAAYDQNYLQKEIFKILADHIRNSGAMVVPFEPAAGQQADALVKDTAQLRAVGLNAGATYVIWGESNWAEESRYTVTAKILAVDSTADPQSFTTTGTGGENLLPVMQEMARRLATIILKQETITEIRITGNKRIEKDAIRRKIKTDPGDVFVPDRLTKDLYRIYAMGYFDDIRITSQESDTGKIVTFQIQEKPTIRSISITGNDAYDDEEIKKELSIKPGSIFNVFIIKREIRKIVGMFKEKNYHNVSVRYQIEPLENNQANLEIIIDQGEEVLVQEILFEGNQVFSKTELMDLKMDKPGIKGWWPISWILDDSELGEMDTTEEGFFSFITGSGELKMETLNNDTAKLNAFYRNHGFMNVRIGEPEIEFKEDGIYIKIKINEGPRFKVGKVDVSGDLIQPKEKLMSRLRIQNEEYVNMGLLRKDTITLTDIYADQGYFYADIYPRPQKNRDTLVADITFMIRKGKPVYFEKIIIAGNTNTRDKVIRRELPVMEQELYSGSKLKRGIRNLNRLDFFEDVKVDTIRGSADDKMILKITAPDKPTGTFTFGMGYSSQDNLFGNVSISERNLFGRGQILRLSAEVSASSSQYQTSFTEPWLFDIPLSATMALYNTYNDYDYNNYARDRLGGSFGLGYPVFDYTRLSLTYVAEENKISNTDSETPLSILALEEEGKTLTSKMISKLHYDTRDKVINTSEGWDNSLTITYAGDLLGGDLAFVKYIAESGYYHPLFWGTVGHLHAEAGYINKNGSSGILPAYERFYLGGLNSLRGFDWNDVGPKRVVGVIQRTDANGAALYLPDGTPDYDVDDDGNIQQVYSEVGGNKYIQFNAEYIFPIVKKIGFMGVVFFDAGNAYEDDLGDLTTLDDGYPNNEGDVDDHFSWTGLRTSYGAGIRWYSPLGPLRLEYGRIIDRREGEKKGRWEFTMGSGF